MNAATANFHMIAMAVRTDLDAELAALLAADLADPTAPIRHLSTAFRTLHLFIRPSSTQPIS